jgi:hypothetical protein
MVKCGHDKNKRNKGRNFDASEKNSINNEKNKRNYNKFKIAVG